MNANNSTVLKEKKLRVRRMELGRDLGAIVATAENKIPLTYINCNLYYTVYITMERLFSRHNTGWS